MYDWSNYMEIFHQFKDTIFLKTDSELERKIKCLQEIENQVVEKEKIQRDIRFAKAGLDGEKEIEYELKNANIGMYVLHDITLVYDDLKAQIDYIVITPAYCYLIECKNLIGNITVNDQGEFRREYSFNGKKVKEAIYSPYRQATRHIDILEKRWKRNNSALKTMLFYNKLFDNHYYKPLIVLANSSGMLNFYHTPQEIKKCTIRVDSLVEYIKKDLATKSRSLWDKKSTMEKVANAFLGAHTEVFNDYCKKYFLKDISTNLSLTVDKELLEEKLKQLRKRKTSTHVPAFFIFDNLELEKILECVPQNIDELKKILPASKVRYHGKDIIDVIHDVIKS